MKPPYRVYGPTVTTMVVMLALLGMASFGVYLLVLEVAGALGHLTLVLPATICLVAPAFLMHALHGDTILVLVLRQLGIAGRTLYHGFGLEWSGIHEVQREIDARTGGITRCTIRTPEGATYEITAELRCSQMLSFVVHGSWRAGRWLREEEGRMVLGQVVPVLSRDDEDRAR